MEPDDEGIGREMRALRKERGHTLREVSRRAGVSVAYLSDLELGRRHWNASITERFRRAVGE